MFLASAPNILLVSLCACCLLAGLYLASLAVHLHSQAKRYVPEPLCFAVLALQGALPAGVYPSAPAAGSSHQRQLAAEDPRWLAIAATDAGVAYLPATAEGIEALDIVQVLSCSGAASDEYWASAAFKTSAAAAAVRLVGRCTEMLAGNVALPEVLAPAQEVLRSIVAATEVQSAAAAAQPGEGQQQQKKQKKKKKGAAAAAPPPAEPAATLAPGLVQLSREVLQQVEAAIEAVRSSRRPMYNMQLLKVAEKRQFNPRFEEDFVSGKDYDPDR